MTEQEIIAKAKKALDFKLRFYFSPDMIDEKDGDFKNLFEKYNKQFCISVLIGNKICHMYCDSIETTPVHGIRSQCCHSCCQY